MCRARLVEIERIGILHQEFTSTHQPEARAHLITEFPLDVIEVEREVLVRLDVGTEDFRDHLLIGRPIQHVSLVPVLDPQHLLAVGIVATTLAPEVGGLNCRHQNFNRAGAVLLLAHDLANFLQHANAERQEGIDARGLLPHHASAQHQPVRDDFGLFRRLTQNRQEITGQAHGILDPWQIRGDEVRVKADRPQKHKARTNFSGIYRRLQHLNSVLDCFDGPEDNMRAGSRRIAGVAATIAIALHTILWAADRAVRRTNRRSFYGHLPQRGISARRSDVQQRCASAGTRLRSLQSLQRNRAASSSSTRCSRPSRPQQILRVLRPAVIARHRDATADPKLARGPPAFA